MEYHEYNFTLSEAEDFHKDLLINSLSEIGFDTFEDTPSGFKAYRPGSDNISELINEFAESYSEMFRFQYEITPIPHQNWNEVWESNFQPLSIENRCYVRATFHDPRPEYEFEIVIDPKMAFGTGHHQTTELVIKAMLDIDFAGLKVLDMGCGTGILAILAAMKGAANIVAIDYDPICYDSTIENAALNNIDCIEAVCGSKEAIPNEDFDIILANINRNILLDQMESYVSVLKPGGIIYFSGFYEDPDLEIIRKKAEDCGLIYHTHSVKDNWVAAGFSN